MEAEGEPGGGGGRQDTNALLAYNRRLISFAKEEGMPPGLGPVSVYGGKFEAGPGARDMRDLYKCAAFPSLSRPCVRFIASRSCYQVLFFLITIKQRKKHNIAHTRAHTQTHKRAPL